MGKNWNGHTAVVLGVAMVLGGCGQRDASVQASSSSASVAAAATSAAQADPYAGPFEISGTAIGLKDGTPVKLIAIVPTGSGEPRMDTVAETSIKDGRFTLSGKVAQASRGGIGWDDKHMTSFILEKGRFEAVLDANKGMVTVHGGDLNRHVMGYIDDPAYLAGELEYAQKSEALFKGVNLSDEKATTAMRAKLDQLVNKGQVVMDEYHWKKLNDPTVPALARLFILSSFENDTKLPQDQRAAMFSKLEKELGGSHWLIESERKMQAQFAQAEAAQKTVAVGSQYKDITVYDAAGKPHKLSDVVAKKKLVLLDFWASWCTPCRGEFPHLRKVHAAHAADGFEIFAVSLDESKEAWEQALKEEKNLPWINLVDTKALDSEAAKAYGIQGVPANFLIGPDGTILGVGMREWDVERTVKAQIDLLKKSKS